MSTVRIAGPIRYNNGRRLLLQNPSSSYIWHGCVVYTSMTASIHDRLWERARFNAYWTRKMLEAARENMASIDQFCVLSEN